MCSSRPPPPRKTDDAQRESNKFFENEVRPLLAKRCFECHGEKKQKGGLRVDQIGYLKTGGDTGPALVPGEPEKSPMIEAVRYKNKDLQMPPKEQLSGTQVAILEKWIALGAPWPETDADKTKVTEGGFTDEQRKFWCFQPLAKVDAAADRERLGAHRHRPVHRAKAGGIEARPGAGSGPA